MRQILVLGVLAASWGVAWAERPRPGELREDDVAKLYAEYCADDGSGNRKPNCSASALTVAEARAANAGVVPLATIESRGKPFCDVAKNADAPVLLRDMCASSFSTFTTIATKVVVEIGAYAKDTAEQQVLDFIFDKIMTKTCDFELAKNATTKFQVSDILPKTCALKRDATALSLQSLGATLRADLYAIPTTLAAAVAKALPDVLANPAVKAAAGILYALHELSRGSTPLQMLRSAYKVAVDSKLTCSATFDARCGFLLIISLGNAAERNYSDNENPQLAKIVNDGVSDFCKTFRGESDVVKCATSFASVDVKTKLEAFVRKIGDIVSHLGPAADAAASAGTVLAIHELIDQVFDFAKTYADKKTDEADSVSLVKNVADALLHVYEKDSAGARDDIKAALENKLIAKKLNGKVKRGLDFIVLVMSAPSGGDIGDQIKALLAPKGTYKIKYERDAWTVALNALVGPAAALQFPRGDGGTRGNAYRLSIPLGLEISTPSESNYLAFGLTFADALGEAVVDDTDGEDSTRSWLFPGVYARWGIWETPFTVVVNAGYRPGVRSPMSCTSDCFDGAYEIGVSLAVDVPLLVLH